MSLLPPYVLTPGPITLPLSVFLFLWWAHSSELISQEPRLIVWLQSSHAASMVTGGVFSCSLCKFNTTSDDISTMWCERTCPCVCVCVSGAHTHVHVQVRLIYPADFRPPSKATSVKSNVLSPRRRVGCTVRGLLHQKMRNINRYVSVICQFVSFLPFGAPGLSVNGGFMSAVGLCIFHSVPLRSGECPCLCKTNVSEHSVWMASERCLIAPCTVSLWKKKGNRLEFFLLRVTHTWLCSRVRNIWQVHRSVIYHPDDLCFFPIMRKAAGAHCVTASD